MREVTAFLFANETESRSWQVVTVYAKQKTEMNCFWPCFATHITVFLTPSYFAGMDVAGFWSTKKTHDTYLIKVIMSIRAHTALTMPTSGSVLQLLPAV